MTDTECTFLVRDMAARVLREHAAGRSVAPDRLDWAIGVAVEALTPQQPAAPEQPRAHVFMEA